MNGKRDSVVTNDPKVNGNNAKVVSLMCMNEELDDEDLTMTLKLK